MMWTKPKSKNDRSFIKEVNRGFLRSTFKSLFWAVISAKRKERELTFSELAETLDKSKSIVSRWFSGDPNWRINTIADLALALEVDINVTAVDRQTGRVFSASGEVNPLHDAWTAPIPSVTLLSKPDEPANQTTSPSMGFVNLG